MSLAAPRHSARSSQGDRSGRVGESTQFWAAPCRGAFGRVRIGVQADGWAEVVAISTDPTTARSVPESAYGFGPPVAPEPRRLYRRPDGRLGAGVASGLAEHLGLSPLLLRAAFALLVAAGGAGVLLYAAFWAVVPQRPLDPAATRTAGSSSTSGGDPGQLVALAALALGAVLLAGVFGPSAANVVVWPVVVGGVGVALLWRQADVAQRGRWLAVPGRVDWRALPAAAGGGRGAVVRIVAGLGLVVAGMAGFLAANNELRQAQDGLLAIVVVVTGLALVSGPWWIRLVGELRAERRARIREQERAEIAAHVHDSVLQTLALIQKGAQDPREVARLARRQERELRAWLYRPLAAGGQSGAVGGADGAASREVGGPAN